METRVYVALGSNLGDRAGNLRQAAGKVAGLASGSMRRSSLYETPAEDMHDAPAFINAVVEFDTGLSAIDLLKALQDIEIAMGRPAHHGMNESRIIDLDIISYGNIRLVDEHLTLPHPRAHTRAFVMVPLAEIEPSLVLPGQTLDARALANGFEMADRMIQRLQGERL